MSITPVSGYGTAKFIVSTVAGQGTHTTLSSAMAAASSGDTIFLRTNITENVTITPGVNIVAWASNSLNTPTIIGTLTMTGAGTSTISGIKLQTNSAPIIAVTGSAASILNIINCYLDCTNNTAITHSSSSSSSLITLQNCTGDLKTTGITYFVSTSAGIINASYCSLANNGMSITPSSVSSGIIVISWSIFGVALSATSTGFINASYTEFTGANNSTCITTSGTGTHLLTHCQFSSGSASCLSIGAGTIVNVSSGTFLSTNTNAITGGGTLDYGISDFFGFSKVINTTNQNNNNSDTFTPVLTFGGGSTGITYTTQSGKYIRLGNIVNFSIDITLSNKGTSTGNAAVSLPYTARAGSPNVEVMVYLLSATTTGTYTVLDIAASATTGTISQIAASTGTATILTDAALTNTSVIRCTGSYWI